METQRGRGIHIEIDVMDLMKTPEKRHPMSQDVPEIKRVIEERDRERHFQPGRQRNQFEQPEAPLFHPAGQWPNEWLLRQLQADRADRRDREIARVAAQLRFHRAAERTAILQPEKRAVSAENENRA